MQLLRTNSKNLYGTPFIRSVTLSNCVDEVFALRGRPLFIGLIPDVHEESIGADSNRLSDSQDLIVLVNGLDLLVLRVEHYNLVSKDPEYARLLVVPLAEFDNELDALLYKYSQMLVNRLVRLLLSTIYLFSLN